MAYGVKTFVNGDKLPASELNDYLMKQVIMRFATETSRDAALTGALAPVEGMTVYIMDTDRTMTYNGTAWIPTATLVASKTYTPTHNITLGTAGTLTASYVVTGKMLTVRIKVSLGTGGVMPTNPSFTIPSGLTMAKSSGWLDGYVDMQQSAATASLGMCQAYSTTQFYARALSASGSYVTLAAITSTVPFTWTVGNTLELEFTTEIV